MRSSSSQVKPFDQGATSVKLQDGLPNPYEEGSIEFNNYELGRAYALHARPALGATVAPARAAPDASALAKAPR